MAEARMTHLGLLLRCYEGLRNGRALALLVGGFVLAALLLALDGAIASRLAFTSPTIASLLGGLLIVLAVLVVLAGLNGSGLLLTDQADGRVPRGVAAAFFGGLGATLQAIVALIVLGVGLLVVVLVLWALSFLARIPGIGAVFAFLLAGPSVLVLAFCYAVLVFGVALMFVAIWRGQGIIGSIGRAMDIVTKRPLDTILHFIVLALLIVPIELLVAAVLLGGSALVGVMYASGGLGGALGGLGLGMGPLSLLANGGGAMGISIGIVIAAVWALFVLIQMLGTILIYDSLVAGTEASSADLLRSKVKQVQAKVDEYRPRADPTPTDAAAAAHCAHCGTALTPGDRFCGECGTPAQ